MIKWFCRTVDQPPKPRDAMWKTTCYKWLLTLSTRVLDHRKPVYGGRSIRGFSFSYTVKPLNDQSSDDVTIVVGPQTSLISCKHWFRSMTLQNCNSRFAKINPNIMCALCIMCVLTAHYTESILVKTRKYYYRY